MTRETLQERIGMTQHITQEQANELAAKELFKSRDAFVHYLCNAAIQHYLDAQPTLNDYVDKCIKAHIQELAKALPVLPEPIGYIDEMDKPRLTKDKQLVDLSVAGGCEALYLDYRTYGLQCAAHARKLALEEAKEAIASANARRVLYVPDCIDVIEALKGK